MLRNISYCVFVAMLCVAAGAQAPVSSNASAPTMNQPSAAPPPQGEQPMPGMQHDHSKMQHAAHSQEMKPASFIENIENHMGDGTSVEPNSTPTPMLMTMRGKWMLMLHGLAFLNFE